MKRYDSASSDYFKACLFIANGYWENEAYDTAQTWLDKIAESPELKKESVLHYRYQSAQIKIYYERNLNQIGINECKEAIKLAAKLNDSFLLRDAYTILGDLYYNIDSIPLSLEHFKKAVECSPLQNRNSEYLDLWGFYEIYQGMAYCYSQVKDLVNALNCANLSCEIAKQSGNTEQIFSAFNLLQSVHFDLNRFDSCLYYAKKIDSISQALDTRNYAILAYRGYMWYYDNLPDKKLVMEYFNKGMELLKSGASVNHFDAQEFLYFAIKILKKYRNYPALIHAIELSNSISTKTLRNAAVQTNGIENAALKKEAQILTAELNEAKQKRKANNLVLVSIILVFVLAFGALLWYFYHQKQKLHVINIKSKISQDLHDDIGASLSSLQIYSTIAEQVFVDDPGKAMGMIKKISEQSKSLMENMNDIVWSMKTSSSSNTSIEIKIKNYAAGLLADSNIDFKYSIMPNADKVITGITARKNILLITKEAMNNIAKYSKAKTASLSLHTEEKDLVLVIADSGTGFNSNAISSGNGLENMEQRTKELKGHFSIDSTPGRGTIVKAVFPLQHIN